jgi:hypothetical protein
MKTVLHMITVMVFLSACSPSLPAVLSPIPNTPSPTPTPTQTPIPPTTTLVPTPTEMRDLETGWKMQIVDGEKQLFSSDVNEWVVLGGKVPLIEHDDRPYTTLEDAFMMEVYYKAGFPGPKISENPAVLEEQRDFTGIFQYKLAVKEYGKPTDLPDTFASDLKLGNFVYSFTTPQGEYTFEVSSNSKYRVYIVPYEEMLLQEGYQEMGDTLINKRFRVLSKADGKNAISITSFDYPLTKLQKLTFMKMIMYTLACIMDPNQKAGLYTKPIQFRPDGLTDYISRRNTEIFEIENIR